MEQPADAHFCEAIRLVVRSVEDRREAALTGGGYGRALERLADRNWNRACGMMAGAAAAKA